MTASDMEIKTDDSALKSARQLFTTFLGASKKLSLYSETHNIYQESLHQLKSAFDDFFETIGSFKIAIKRDQITYNDQEIHHGESEPTDIAFVLYRDGILWMEFLPGMALWEIDTFLRMFKKYAKLEEDAEDDIVTSLWQYNMPSILYEATEPSFDGKEDIDFSEFQCSPDESEIVEQQTQDQEKLSQSDTAGPPPGPAMPPLSEKDALWRLTPEEREQLRKMIAEEEKLDGTDYVIEVLLYILEKQVQPDDDLVNLLNILSRELKEVLIQGRYGYLANVLAHLKKYIEKLKFQGHFTSPHFEIFFQSLSTEIFLDALPQTFAHIETARASEIKELRRALLTLHESAVDTLGAMLQEAPSVKIQRLLLEVIGTFCRRDFKLMDRLIQASTPPVIIQLARILRSLNNEAADRKLHALLNHESVKVREEALKNIVNQGDGIDEDMFNLLSDPDENIRKMVLLQMGNKKDPQTEEMLLNYIQANDFVKKDSVLYFDFLRTLGRCGSERSLPFLHQQLFLWPSLGILRPMGSKNRKAIIAALNEINTRNATFLANRAERGFMYNFLRASKLTRKK